MLLLGPLNRDGDLPNTNRGSKQDVEGRELLYCYFCDSCKILNKVPPPYQQLKLVKQQNWILLLYLDNLV